jgi:hypothetical protein
MVRFEVQYLNVMLIDDDKMKEGREIVHIDATNTMVGIYFQG